MAHSHFVIALSQISKNYVFRFQIFCHIDLVLPSVCFRCGGLGVGGRWGGVCEHLVLYQITMYSFKSEIQRQPTMFKLAKFVLVIKNNEAVLVIK